MTDDAVAKLQGTLKTCRITTNSTPVAKATEKPAATEEATDDTEKVATDKPAEPQKPEGEDKEAATKPTSPAKPLSRAAKYAIGGLEKIDADKNGSLNKEEWSQNKFIKDSFDKDEDGKITLEELTKGFGG